MTDNRTEHRLHEAFYSQLQGEVLEAERAISDARQFIYAVLSGRLSDQGVRDLGQMWLERHGRDRRREPPEEAAEAVGPERVNQAVEDARGVPGGGGL